MNRSAWSISTLEAMKPYCTAPLKAVPRVICGQLSEPSHSRTLVGRPHEAVEDGSVLKFQKVLRGAAQHFGRTLFTAGATAALLCSPGAAIAEEVLRFPASSDPHIFAVQQTLVEAWRIVRQSYVDASFNHLDWERELSKALYVVYTSTDPQKAYGEIGHMLERLGDPYTRVVPPSEYADFRVSSDGEVQGVGLMIAADAESGKLVVLAPIKGGPAERAGVQAGDLVVSIDGNTTDGWDGERAAKFLRGRSGSSVTVKFARRTDQVPGVPGRPEELPSVRYDYQQVRLKREKVELSSVFALNLEHEGRRYGYIRLANFSQHAAEDMRTAIRDLQGSGVSGFILDLRNNPGGLVKAGLEVARLWMSGGAPVLNVVGREDGNRVQLQRVALEEGQALTDLPLTVLINKNSASASEILAGALQDSGRAQLVGNTRSYGKGKIQSVFELDDGSALFVTVAKYKTPAMNEIDQVGINPDLSCSLSPGAESEGVPGMPIGPLAESTVAAQLDTDGCVLTAEALLDTKDLMLAAPAILAS